MSEMVGDHERLWPFMRSGVILPPWKKRKTGSGGGYAQSGLGLGPGFFLMCVEFERVLNCGLRAIVDEAKQALKDLRYESEDCIKRTNYLSSVILVHEAAIAAGEPLRGPGRVRCRGGRIAAGEEARTRTNRRDLPACSGAPGAYLLRGDAVLLVHLSDRLSLAHHGGRAV